MASRRIKFAGRGGRETARDTETMQATDSLPDSEMMRSLERLSPFTDGDNVCWTAPGSMSAGPIHTCYTVLLRLFVYVAL